jgi:hypothetical protein
LFAYSSFHFGLLGGFLGSNFFVLFCLGFGDGWGGGSGEWDTFFFFFLSNNSVLFAVLFLKKKSFVLNCRVCKDCNYSQKHFPKAPQKKTEQKICPAAAAALVSLRSEESLNPLSLSLNLLFLD